MDGGRRVGERLSIGVDVLEGEEWVREMVEGVRDAGGTGFGDKADMGAVVGESRRQIKTPYAVPRPWRAFSGGVVDHDELTGGVEGLGIEIVRGAAETVPGWERRVFSPMTEVIEGKFGGGKQFRPTVGGESYVGRRENRN
jgi:hypothetical protein